MTPELSTAIFCAGLGQLCILVASALVPLRLDWRRTLATLPPLVRQLFWVYGGYVVLSIIGLGIVCTRHSEELAAGTPLARAVCAYGAAFWGIRLSLQAVLQAKPYLTAWWLRGGYHLLTLFFAGLTAVLGWAAIH
uniref:DUF4149 domain-containing protein n=1 Tax=Schlesneria paludicola TaxID=360056 RepID=A0A7C2JY86_9PLAN